MDDHFFSTWGFWITLAGLVLGIGGIAYGVWARDHPKSGRVIFRINESSLVPVGTSSDRMRIIVDEEEITDPYVAVIEIINTGPNDLSPQNFKGGRLRISTTHETGESSPTLRGNLSTKITGRLSDESPDLIAGKRMPIQPTPFYPCHFDVDPFQLKKNSLAAITLLSSGKPNLTIDARLTDFEVTKVKQQGVFADAFAATVIELNQPIVTVIKSAFGRR